MRKTFRFMSALLAVVVITFALTFTSCGDDDEPDKTNIYTAGFGNMSSSSLNMFAEMQTIEDAFKAELGDSPIILKGETKKCNSEILSKCKKAETALSSVSFTSKIQYIVTNSTTDEVIYDHTFGNSN